MNPDQAEPPRKPNGPDRPAAGPSDPATPPSDPAMPGAPPREIGGPKGPEPTRYRDWERGGRCIDF